jgi:hypothetical protein
MNFSSSFLFFCLIGSNIPFSAYFSDMSKVFFPLEQGTKFHIHINNTTIADLSILFLDRREER